MTEKKMPKRDAKRVRKPPVPLKEGHVEVARVESPGWWKSDDQPTVWILAGSYSVAEARRLASWLNKFADWAEQEAKRGKT